MKNNSNKYQNNINLNYYLNYFLSVYKSEILDFGTFLKSLVPLNSDLESENTGHPGAHVLSIRYLLKSDIC